MSNHKTPHTVDGKNKDELKLQTYRRLPEVLNNKENKGMFFIEKEDGSQDVVGKTSDGTLVLIMEMTRSSR
jgi:hypothetical protein